MIKRTRVNYNLWLNFKYDQLWYTPTLQPYPIKYSFSYVHGLKPGE